MTYYLAYDLTFTNFEWVEIKIGAGGNISECKDRVYNPYGEIIVFGGIVVVTAPLRNGRILNILPVKTMFLHKAIPGHHYQISLLLEDSPSPPSVAFYGMAPMARAGPCTVKAWVKSWGFTRILTNT
jgi:Uncharacterized protein conserved in bacteria